MKHNKTYEDKNDILINALQEIIRAKNNIDLQNIILNTARKLSNSDVVNYVVTENNFCNYIAENSNERILRGKKFPLDSSICGWSILKKTIIVIDDISQDNTVKQNEYKNTSLKSLIILPIGLDLPKAAIAICWKEKNIATSINLNLLQILTESAFNALKNIKYTETLNNTINSLNKEFKGTTSSFNTFKKSEEIVGHNAITFKKIFEHSNIGIAITDPNGNIINVNKEFTKIIGYSQSKLLKMNFAEFTYSEDLDIEIDMINQLLCNKIDNYRIHKRYFNRKGEIIWVDIAVSCLRDTNNQIDLLYAMIMDITDKKKAEQRFLNTLDNMQEGCQIIDYKWNYTYLNHTAELHNRRPNNELIGQNYQNMWPGIENTKAYQLIKDCMENRNSHFYENEFTYPDNSVGWFELTIEPISEGVLILSIDITNIKQATLKASENMDRLINAQRIAKMGDFTLIVETGEITWSKALFELLGYDNSTKINYENVNKNIHHPDDEDKINNWINSCVQLDTDILTPNEYRLIKKDGNIIYVRVQGHIIRNESDPITIFGTVQDITEQKIIETNQKLTKNILDTLNSTNDTKLMVNSIVKVIHEFKDIEAVGIRIKKGSYYPFYGSIGYNDDFINNKKHFCNVDSDKSKDFKCICQNIIEKKDSILQLNYTESGCFLSNDISLLFNNIKDKTNLLLKNSRCYNAGYRSLAIIPIKVSNEIIGLIQLNDHRENIFAQESISIYEEIASNLGVALSRNQAKELLKKNEILLKETGKLAKVGGWEFDIETGEGTWTEAVAKIHEFDINDNINKKIGLSYYKGEYYNLINNAIANAINNFQPYDLELKLTTHRGSQKWVHTIGIPEVKNGKVVKISGSMQDITDKKQAEIALKENEEKYRNLFMYSPDAIFINQNDKILLVNEAMLHLMKVNDENLLVGMNPKELFQAKNFNSERFTSTKRSSKQPVFEDLIIDKKGNIRDVEIHQSVFKIGEVVANHVILRDITKKKEIEKEIENHKKNLENLVKQRTLELYHSEEKYRGLYETVKDGIVRTDLKGAIIECNPEFRNMLGYSFDEITQLTIWDLTPPKWISPKKDIINNEVFVNGYSDALDKEFLHKNGTFIAVSERIRLEKDSDMNPIGMWSIVRDITKRKETENAIINLNYQLKERQIALENSNKELEAFSYSVSHDLRAPLRAITGFTKILIEDYSELLDDEAKRICNVIDESATNMGKLIDDLLSFSRLGRHDMQYSTINMKNLALLSFKEICPPELLDKTDITIENIPSISADPHMILLVWNNLLSNAIKYSSKQECINIQISSTIQANSITYFIKDNGVGFNMKYKDKLFGVFQRLHKSTDFEGTGVGLALVQRIIKRHNGTIWAESELSKGATFYFKLPILNQYTN
ncbi:PAS domain S-box protein [Plebeiibacterium sediminum]|uniref:histidine kinase n=1 Tax=Plebeiibacterium sediminum TaxID=2992112 RepID=A0AAE3M5E9_9BACT|nr:PAS domain S-box protein [Plebeiobacterium sediminum]MCW3787459.1 PAS domain S-box protein [Plebeiobacterium sediminum]